MTSVAGLTQSPRARYTRFLGPWSGGVTPVPIPNTVVKPASAEDTRDVGPRENRSGPGSNDSARERSGRFFCSRRDWAQVPGEVVVDERRLARRRRLGPPSAQA